MARNEYPGLFIAFEGLDGAGASIQAQLLAGLLEKQGYRVVSTNEPTTNLIGGMIKAHLSGEWHVDERGVQLLFAADRAQHIERQIAPALAAGKIVIIDRYILSSIAYGSHNNPELLEWLEAMNQPFLTPDLTFIIKVRPSICALRMERSRYENLGMFEREAMLGKIWKVYETIAKKYYQVHIVDGEQEEMSVIRDIADITMETLGDAKKSAVPGGDDRP